MPLPLINRLRASGGVSRDFRAALAMQAQGRWRDAEELYRGVLQRDPAHVQALFNLGLVRIRQGAVDDAIELLERTVRQDPDFAEARNALGIALRLSNRAPEALAHYAAALAIRPDYAEVENNIGLALQSLDRCAEAVPHYQRAVALRPDYAEAEHNLGAALRLLHRYEEALAHFQKALAMRPGSAEGHNNLGAVLQLLARHEEALAAYETALALKPDLAEARHGRGTALRTLGRLDDAREELERAIALAPRKAEFYRSLAEAKRFVADDPHRAMIEALARDMATLSEDDQIHLHFALGKVYSDLGEDERAFDHLIAGNALKRGRIVYDERAALARLERMRALFGAEVMRERAGQGDPSPLPVFIIGMPRSGTSLVEQILASHPQVFGAGELSDLETAVAGLAGPNGAPADIGAAELRAIGARYVARVKALAPAARRVTDKMPANFAYAGLIHLALPNARIIHLRRDPIDTCLSCFSLLFGGHQPHTYDLAELGHYYRAYEKLMTHWRAVLPAGVMLEVDYEEVVDDFERQSRRIVGHCGLDWDEACLDFHKTQRAVHTASATQVRQPLYRTSIGKWRPSEAVLRPLLDALASDA